MNSEIKIDMRLEQYFFDFLKKHSNSEDDLRKEVNEFYEMSFSTSRNIKTKILKNDILCFLDKPLEYISDNIIVTSSLKNCLNDLIDGQFVIADKLAFEFLQSAYSICLKPNKVEFIDDFHVPEQHSGSKPKDFNHIFDGNNDDCFLFLREKTLSHPI